MDILPQIQIFKYGDEMPERLFAGQVEWLHIWLAALTAMWGGLVSYFRQILAGEQHSWAKAFIHLSMSGFAGLICLLGCLHFSVPVYLTGILAGLAGHMGAKFANPTTLPIGAGRCAAFSPDGSAIAVAPTAASWIQIHAGKES